MFQPPRPRPIHTTVITCSCGARGTFASTHSVAVTAQVDRFYEAHRRCTEPDTTKEDT